MTPPVPPSDERQRIQALLRTGLLDTLPEPDYDDIVRLAAESCDAPIALISLVAEERQWFKAKVGLPGVDETDRCISFCAHAIERDELFLIEDAHADARFAANPLVLGHPFIRFYAGVPLRTTDGYALGTLCVIDQRPRTLTALQRRSLLGLSRQVELLVRMRERMHAMQAHNEELARAHERTQALNLRLRAEMEERQRIEGELREQRTLLSSILTHIPYSVFWKDRQGAYLGANPHFLQDMGLESQEALLGKTDLELSMPRAQAEAYRRDDFEVMESGQPKISFEEPLARTSGEESWLLTSKVPLKHPDGTVVGMVGIFADISERRRQQQALQDAKLLVERHVASLEAQVREAHLRNHYLMQNSGAAVFLLNEEGSVLDLNPVAQRVLGGSEDALRGLAFESFAPEKNREPLRRALRDLRVVGTVRMENQPMDTVTGSRVMLDLAASLQVTGNTRRLLVVGHDVTEKWRLEQQSIQNERLASMGALAAGIAHEINNPMAYVLSNLTYLQESRDELEHVLESLPGGIPARAEEMLAEVKDILAESLAGGRRIRDIVRDMRFFSHTAGEELAPVDLHACLDVVLRMAHGELKHVARVDKRYDSALPLVPASEGRLSQVFLNLVINAVHAMRSGKPEDQVLRVITRRDGDWARIEISDSGTGIPPDVLPHIFEPFFTTKPAGAGTGLGLSISLSILQKMGGGIQVQSTVGVGTTFLLSLPVHGREPL
ncbi:PAS domain-containing protein [Archangium primigenium]|uniref:PAS domain-containing protein n=1 Tax=[Archangium] primigenium TaxID=2792470 RepID=UPI00195F0422|nr:PAS domain-containing protein [Archangium primigenium]MBM7115519.1 PAS domain-containing protein [Archangium primigenium]